MTRGVGATTSGTSAVLAAFPGVWTHGDWAAVDADGYWYLQDDATTRQHSRHAGRACRARVGGDRSGIVTEAAAVGVRTR